MSRPAARAIQEVLDDDEKALDLINKGKRPIVYRTQQDAKVDDKICLPLEGAVFDINDSKRVKIPDDTHPNCRCNYFDFVTGELLGQI